MNTLLATAAPLPLPASDSHWREWVTYGLRWAAARPPIPTQHPQPWSTVAAS